jgi:lipoprotein-releasing system permease protein
MTTERWPARYELFVGLRYILSRSGNRFISFISVTSILGIAIGVAVLIIVLSVVNGFEQELRARILSMTSHAAITGMERGLKDWEEARRVALADPEVEYAAPFIEGEGMLVHGERVSGAGLRGVLPAAELEVSGIGDKMVAGELAS